LENERQQITFFTNVLSRKRNNCTVVDVGMNDGFYTQLAAKLGCHVFSFEIQPSCINISKLASEKNVVTTLINITEAPVSSVGGQEIDILFPDKQVCDGGFTFSGPAHNREKRTHNQLPLVIKRHFTTVSLSSFPPLQENGAKKFIDIIKIDVEGHEAEVMEGILQLLKEDKVGAITVELGPPSHYDGEQRLMKVYSDIVKLGYQLKTFNCPRDRGDDDVFVESNFQEFVNFYHTVHRKWRCYDILIQPMTRTRTLPEALSPWQ